MGYRSTEPVEVSPCEVRSPASLGRNQKEATIMTDEGGAFPKSDGGASGAQRGRFFAPRFSISSRKTEKNQTLRVGLGNPLGSV